MIITFTILWNYYFFLVSNHFNHPQSKPIPFKLSLPILPFPQGMVSPNMILVSLDLTSGYFI